METHKEMQKRWIAEIDERVADCRREIAQLETLKKTLRSGESSATNQRKPPSRRRGGRSASRSNGSAKPSEQTRAKVASVLTAEPMTGQQVARLAGMNETSVRGALRALVSEGKATAEAAEKAPGQVGKPPMLYSGAPAALRVA